MAMTGGTAKLVHTGYANYGAAGAINLYVYYKTSQSVATNKSTITVGMYVTSPSSSYTIGPWSDNRGSYVGTTSNTFDGSIPNFGGTRWLVENKTFTVTHDDDGKGSATIYWKWGVNSPWGQTENPSGSFTITLPTIARASTITSVANVNLGSKTKVVWTPKSSSFYYKVKLSLGDWVYTSSAIHPNTTSAYTYTTATIPYDVAYEFASTDTSGTMTATLYTYSNSACTSQVGSEDTETFKVTLPDNSSTKPTFAMSLSPVNASGVAWEDLYVQSISKVQASFSGSGNYGATITSYKMTVEGKTYSSPYTSSALAIDGTITVTGYATDSRGRTKSVTKDITVIPYGKPRIFPHTEDSDVVCARCTSDGTLDEAGTYLRIRAMRSYSKIMSDETQHNFCYLYYRYKVSGGTYSSWYHLLEKTDTSTDLVDEILPDICSDVTASYSVQLLVMDSVGGYEQPTHTIPTDSQDFNLKEGGGGAAFGKYSELDKTVEIAGDWSLVVHGDRWVDLGLSTSVSAPAASFGRVPLGTCCYRVENGNHVYIAFNCAFTWSNATIKINANQIPEAYRPKRDTFGLCACYGRNIARVAIGSLGSVLIDYVQYIPTSTSTSSAEVTWVDGYIDYFI